jgi:arylsulfatase A-like enzyme
VDAVIGRILETLESREQLDDTVLAVVGDHGESLGEHEEQTHSILIYNSTIHVPMLIHAPGRIPQRKVGRLVRTIDLTPTLLDYLQIQSLVDEDGSLPPLAQGRSLRPLIDDGELPEDIVVYSESLYPSLNLGWSALQGLEKGRYRFISAPREELYDLSEDPGEKVNQIDRLPEIAATFREQLNCPPTKSETYPPFSPWAKR